MRLKLYATAAVAALAATVSLSLSPAHAGTSGPAPLLARAEAVPGSYLVVLRPSVSTATASAAFAQAVDLGGSVAHRYSHVLDGFAATLSDDAVEALRRNPSVAYIEPDAVWHRDTAVALQDTQTPPDGAWGLDRVDQRTLPLSTTYTPTPAPAKALTRTSSTVASGTRTRTSAAAPRACWTWSETAWGRRTAPATARRSRA